MNSSWEAAFTWRESETARLHRDPPAPSWVGGTAAEQPDRDTDGVDGARWPLRALTNQILPYSHEPILQHAGDLTARSQKATGRLLGPATTMEVALHHTASSSRLLQERAQLRTEQKFKN